MILLVDLDLYKIHLRRFMYTTWKKFIIMIIIIRFGIEPGIYKTIIAAVSNNFMIVWMMNTRRLILEQGGVWVLEWFYLLFSFLFWLISLKHNIICFYTFINWFAQDLAIRQNVHALRSWRGSTTLISTAHVRGHRANSSMIAMLDVYFLAGNGFFFPPS